MGSIAGLTALLLRAPDRAASTIDELAARGAGTVLCPLIDFELPADTAPIDAGLRRLAAGEYDWVVITSITTLRALKQRATALGVELELPEGTRLAAVAEASARAARIEGLGVDFVPEDKTGAGLAAELPVAPGDRVFVAQTDIAASTVSEGLAERGVSADVVTAYRTVDAPADPAQRLTASLAVGDAGRVADAPLLEPSQLRARLGEIDAVLCTSPSIARRFAEVAGTDFAGPAVAIGTTTAAELTELGFAWIVQADAPTPAAMADAWAASLD